MAVAFGRIIYFIEKDLFLHAVDFAVDQRELKCFLLRHSVVRGPFTLLYGGSTGAKNFREQIRRDDFLRLLTHLLDGQISVDYLQERNGTRNEEEKNTTPK